MAIYYYGGECGLQKNMEAAAGFFQESAAKGNPVAMTSLGGMYRDGVGGFRVSIKDAITWLERGRRGGDVAAVKALAAIYLYGTGGVSKDAAKSHALYAEAAKAGDEYSQGFIAAEPIAVAFQTYTAADATDANHAKALAAAKSEMGQLDGMGLVAVLTVLADPRIQLALDSDILKKKDDPMRMLESTAVDHAIDLFRHSRSSVRHNELVDFSDATSSTVVIWKEDRDFERVAAFWKDCYSDQTFATQTLGEKEKTLDELAACVISLLEVGNRGEAVKQLDDALAMSDAVLAARPWDWYMKSATQTLCFDVAECFADLNDEAKSQAMLRRAWAIASEMRGYDGLLDRNRILPLKGKVLDGATEADKAYFGTFKEGTKSGMMKRFTIPCDFDGVKAPFYFYILHGKNGYLQLQDQIRWLREYRGGKVPKEMIDSFGKLNRIAVENNVDFSELVQYAMGDTTTKPSADKK